MPRPTFFNLPEEKRQAFLSAAIDEFAENDYQSVSISRLLANLGIAKGSFYQYFEDKRDLYFFLIDFVMKERMDFIQKQSGNEKETDFLQYIQELLEIGIRFDFAYPKHGQLIYRTLNGNGSMQNESVGQFKASLLDYQREIIALGVSMGIIDPDLDPELMARFLNAIMADFGRNMIPTIKFDSEQIKQGDFSQIDKKLMQEQSRQIIHMVFNGISKK
jgi:TetR/AcrR family transcriptional regulator